MQSQTSGSTGQPKRFALSDDLLRKRTERLAQTKGEGFAECRSILLGVGRSTARQYVRRMEKIGGRVIPAHVEGKRVEPGSAMKELAARVIAEKPEAVVGLPGWLLALARELKGRHTFKHILSCGAKTDPATASEIRASLGSNLWASYGTSETSTIALASYDDLMRGMTGKLLPGVEAKIVDGEILVKTPVMIESYVDERRGKKGALVDGWFHTGDMGRFTDDGYVVVTGRKKRAA